MTEEDKTLVKRLRDSFEYDRSHYAPDPLVAEAADRIEALEAKVERLRKVLKTTHNLAVAYAAGTGTLFDEAMAEARATLEG